MGIPSASTFVYTPQCLIFYGRDGRRRRRRRTRGQDGPIDRFGAGTGRCSGNPKTTTLSSVLFFFVSKLGVYSIHVRLTFGFPPFVVCVPSSAPQRNKEASNEKKQLKSAPLFYPLCVFLLGWAGAFAVLCCTAAVTGDE